MRFGMHLPKHRPIIRVQRIHKTVRISKEGYLAFISDGNGRLHCSCSSEGPPCASCGCIERVHRTIFTADEKLSCKRGRLAERCRGAWKTECPFQLEVFYALAIQSSRECMLEAAVANVNSPPCPDGRIRGRIEISRAKATHLGGCRKLWLTQEIGHRGFLGLRQ